MAKEASLLTRLAEAHGVDRVRLWHETEPRKMGDKKGPPTGATFAVFWKGTKRYVGISRTHRSDNFSKKTARMIAINKAVHAMKCDLDPEYKRRPTKCRSGIPTGELSRSEKLANRCWRDKPNILILDIEGPFTAGAWIEQGAPNFLMEETRR
jgi:hypothetical protein